ncbi:MAG: site-specific DNA-methyltransferase [Deltaproteobacteria bacterium]|nr:site-specific DNA-methyltransferase [Deltaproteobacteria bacterium]
MKPIPEESVNFDKSENLFIEGENLEVLKVLQKAYYGKVKCIIIDPPYNTGSDSFIYPDKFSEKKEDYLKRIGDKDEEGYLMKEGLFRKNSKDSGHYHSNWLSMMYPRLFLAKNLLRDDGVIFVHIDDNEVHNLRMVMNEIFGEENFVAQIVWQKKYGPANDAKYFSATHEYVIGFAKRLENWKPILYERNEEQLSAFKNPDNDARGVWRASDLSARTANQNCNYPIILPSGKIVYPPASRSWIISKEKFEELVKDKRIWFGVDGSARPMQKKFLSEVKEGITPQTWWDREFADDNKNARYEIKEIFPENIFDTPKPTKLIKRLIEVSTNNDDSEIILDFFGGSATTAHAVIDKNKEDGGNRKFILVQMPEPCYEASEAYKAGYKTIADIGKERIRRVIKKIEKEKTEKPDLFDKGNLDLGFKVFKLSSSSFKIWRSQEITEENLEQQLDVFTNPARPGAEKQNMLYELMLKAGYGLTSPVQYVTQNHPSPQSSPAEGRGSLRVPSTLAGEGQGGGYYRINNELIIALDAMSEKLVEQIIAAKPQKVITLDSLFTGNDQLKTNTVLQMRDAGVDFKTI